MRVQPCWQAEPSVLPLYARMVVPEIQVRFYASAAVSKGLASLGERHYNAHCF